MGKQLNVRAKVGEYYPLVGAMEEVDFSLDFTYCQIIQTGSSYFIYGRLKDGDGLYCYSDKSWEPKGQLVCLEIHSEDYTRNQKKGDKEYEEVKVSPTDWELWVASICEELLKREESAVIKGHAGLIKCNSSQQETYYAILRGEMKDGSVVDKPTQTALCNLNWKLYKPMEEIEKLPEFKASSGKKGGGSWSKGETTSDALEAKLRFIEKNFPVAWSQCQGQIEEYGYIFCDPENRKKFGLVPDMIIAILGS
jgi:hypothetical protein